MKGVAGMHKGVAGVQGKPSETEFHCLPLSRRLWSGNDYRSVFSCFIVPFICFCLLTAYPLSSRHRISAADLTGSAAFTGKLLRSHILLDHCTIFVVVIVILPDEQVLRKN